MGRIFACMMAVIALASCGFQPLYGERAQGSVTAATSEIKIELIADRLGQQLHNALRDRLNPKGGPARPLYVLRVAVNENKRQLAIRKDETTSRANLRLSATFEIFDSGLGTSLMKGTARATSSYNVLDSDFATLSAERDARERAVRVLADEITLRIGGFFHDRRTGGG